ncbi:hypothetical protein ACFYNY_24155 [Streptomyces sp. NPDC006530]|uniref:hypothetical protein n=1 Tax=Streptomyces sp. NPDC006530 TaxID=3364750 RepID=UPI0036890398
MPTLLRARATAAGLLAVAGLAVAVAPAAPVSYVDERANVRLAEAGFPCAYGLVVTHWHRPGSQQRTISWIYATRSPARAHNLARWWYQTPGGPARAGGTWHGGKTVQTWTQITWGPGGHGRLGPDLPEGSRICTEFNYDATARPCITLT